MKALAIYYIDSDGVRQKFEIPRPSSDEIDHYCWVAEQVKANPEGHSVSLFGARRVLPDRTDRQDWLLERHGVRTIRTEEIDVTEQLELGEEAA